VRIATHWDYQILSQLIKQEKLKQDNFSALGKLWIAGMLGQDHIEAVISSKHPFFLVQSLIHLKNAGILNAKNQSFIIAYPGFFTIPFAHMLVYLDQAGLNTLENREKLRTFSYPLPLHQFFSTKEPGSSFKE
jgi:hypothetical protein